MLQCNTTQRKYRPKTYPCICACICDAMQDARPYIILWTSLKCVMCMCVCVCMCMCYFCIVMTFLALGAYELWTLCVCVCVCAWVMSDVHMHHKTMPKSLWAHQTTPTHFHGNLQARPHPPHIDPDVPGSWPGGSVGWGYPRTGQLHGPAISAQNVDSSGGTESGWNRMGTEVTVKRN